MDIRFERNSAGAIRAATSSRFFWSLSDPDSLLDRHASCHILRDRCVYRDRSTAPMDADQAAQVAAFWAALRAEQAGEPGQVAVNPESRITDLCRASADPTVRRPDKGNYGRDPALYLGFDYFMSLA